MSDYEQAREDTETSARLTAKMKIICVGRFLLDMPNDAQVDLGSATIDGIDLAAFKETKDEFRQRLADREAQSGPNGPVSPSVFEGTAVALWDKIVPTFRLLANEPRLSAGPWRVAVTRAPRSDIQASAPLLPAAQ